jgi:hypothetical protein
MHPFFSASICFIDPSLFLYGINALVYALNMYFKEFVSSLRSVHAVQRPSRTFLWRFFRYDRYSRAHPTNSGSVRDCWWFTGIRKVFYIFVVRIP